MAVFGAAGLVYALGAVALVVTLMAVPERDRLHWCQMAFAVTVWPLVIYKFFRL